MRAKTKTQLFNELKSLNGFNILNHRAVQESENVRELKNALAYYYSKYECLARQTGERKFFLGEIYFTSSKICNSQLLQLNEIAKFMGYDIKTLTW